MVLALALAVRCTLAQAGIAGDFVESFVESFVAQNHASVVASRFVTKSSMARER